MVDGLRRRPALGAALLLFAVCAAWGATFVVVKSAVMHAPVAEFLGWRFLVAAAALVAVRPSSILRLSRRAWIQGVALGAALAAGYLLQTYGLRLTSAAVSGFLTGLQVVFTPAIGWLLLRHRPRTRTWLAVGVATAGLAVISLRGVEAGAGEALTLGSAAAFALQIVGVGRWARRDEAYGTTTVQLLTVSVVCFAWGLPHGLGVPTRSGVWLAIVVTALAATAFAFAVQMWAQAHLSATQTSVIFTTEPVFAALFAWTAGERLGWPVLLGGAMVVGSMLLLGFARDGQAPHGPDTGSSQPIASCQPPPRGPQPASSFSG